MSLWQLNHQKALDYTQFAEQTKSRRGLVSMNNILYAYLIITYLFVFLLQKLQPAIKSCMSVAPVFNWNRYTSGEWIPVFKTLRQFGKQALNVINTTTTAYIFTTSSGLTIRPWTHTHYIDFNSSSTIQPIGYRPLIIPAFRDCVSCNQGSGAKPDICKQENPLSSCLIWPYMVIYLQIATYPF